MIIEKVLSFLRKDKIFSGNVSFVANNYDNENKFKYYSTYFESLGKNI